MSDRRIAAQWSALRRARRPALIPYLTAGYPTRAVALDALRMLAARGADFIEVGVPFSDPLADGPAIQYASQVALEGGMSVAGTLELVATARLSVPVILFSYLNPLLAYDPAAFARDAVAAGVAGVLVTDLPAGEDPGVEAVIRGGGLDLVRLIAPTTTDRRLRHAVRDADGFIYLISRLGVTGARTTVTDGLEETVGRVRCATNLPIAVGFGMAGAEQARAVARFADGVVVGSALVERLGRGLAAAEELMRELRDALGEA